MDIFFYFICNIVTRAFLFLSMMNLCYFFFIKFSLIIIIYMYIIYKNRFFVIVTKTQKSVSLIMHIYIYKKETALGFHLFHY